MRQECGHCGKRRGNRYCPSLDGPICSRCCGEYRLVKIPCPSSCPHLEQHETFQREKQGARYREAWIRINADLRDREEDLQLIFSLEYLFMKAAERIEGLTDTQVSAAVSELLGRLGPIELVTQAPSQLGRLLWEDLASKLQQGTLSREQVKDGFTRLGKVVETLRDPGAPRAFLQGLSAHLEGILPEKPPQDTRGLIVTPDDLRRTR